jgi:S-sulfo-L-cysteine synthase (O-acetyl-L-serine-dependent)
MFLNPYREHQKKDAPLQALHGKLVQHIGKTPILELSRSVRGLIPKGVHIYAKLENANPGGSVKDRTAWGIILRAEKSGELTRGQTILDASSGNTGIAYAMIAAQRGYRLKLCLPKTASAERKRLLKAYGAIIELTDPLEGSDGAIRRAKELAVENPDYFYADQYNNPGTWQIHYETTGPELWQQTHGQLTHFIAGLGTSGTFMGTLRYLKERNPKIRGIGVQPDAPFHGLEGLKHMESSIVPGIFDPRFPDINFGASTEESLQWTRRLATTEGLLVGPSSGAALSAAVYYAQHLTQGHLVVIFCDDGARYLSEDHIFGGEG